MATVINQFQNPTSTTIRNRWTVVGGAGINDVHGVTDEGVDNHDGDTTYVHAALVGAKFAVGLESPPDGVPTDLGEVFIRSKAKRINQGSPPHPLYTQSLWQGDPAGTGTQLASSQATLGADAQNTYVTRPYNLTVAEAESITDWTDLYLQVVVDAQPDVQINITAIELRSWSPRKQHYGPFMWNAAYLLGGSLCGRLWVP